MALRATELCIYLPSAVWRLRASVAVVASARDVMRLLFALNGVVPARTCVCSAVRLDPPTVWF
jgi:hypothetical protein